MTRNTILAIAFAALAAACGTNSSGTDFCPTARCAAGTVCDEKQNKVCSRVGPEADGFGS